MRKGKQDIIQIVWRPRDINGLQKERKNGLYHFLNSTELLNALIELHLLNSPPHVHWYCTS
jgi:hypothetical protein